MARIVIPILFVLGLLFGLSFAYWSANISVYVIGADGIGLSNATVSVVYQATQCGYHEQIEKQTDSQGFVNFQFMNTIDETFNPTCVEHFFTINAALAGFSNSTVGYVNNTTNNYFIALPLLQHELIVLDSSNSTLANANAAFEGTTFYSNNAGEIFVSVPSGTVSNVVVSYGNITTTVGINPLESSPTIVSLPVYDLNVRLFNDQGNQINGTVTFNNVQALSTTESPALFPLFTEKSAQFTVNTAGVQRTVNENITSDTLDIYLDITPPSIRDVTTKVTGE